GGFDPAFDVCLPAGPVQHEVRRNLAVARALGASAQDGSLDLRITDKDRREASRLLENVPPGSKLIAVGIGAGSVGRRWPVHRYAETCNRLAQDDNVWPVVICSPAELKDALDLQASLRGRATVISGAALRTVCAVIQRCTLFLGNDSGCAHLA